VEIIKPHTKIDFVGKIKFALILSWVLIGIGIVSMVIKGGPLYGIDFRGGTLMQIKFAKKVSAGGIRKALKDMGVQTGSVQSIGAQGDNEFLLNFETTQDDLEQFSEKIHEQFVATFGKGSFEIRRAEIVGPKVGKDLREKGLMAIGLSCIGMLVYIWFRFEFRFGLGAIVGLIHDVLITMGALSLTNTPIDLPVVAALLTIVGYSVNDTIIVCDRIRENMPKMTREKLSTIINISVNQTLSRTILTAGTTIMAIIALYIFGGTVIHDFAFTILVGVITGTYSSIYVACPVVIFWEKIFAPKKKGRR
jgi:preprotein translocase subunit SecF